MSCRHGDRGLQVWVQRKGLRLEFKKHFSKTSAHLKPVSYFCSLRLHLATWFVLLGRVQTFSFLFLHAEEGSACLIYSWRSDLVNTQQRSACEQDSAVHALEHNHVQFRHLWKETMSVDRAKYRSWAGSNVTCWDESSRSGRVQGWEGKAGIKFLLPGFRRRLVQSAMGTAPIN